MRRAHELYRGAELVVSGLSCGLHPALGIEADVRPGVGGDYRRSGVAGRSDQLADPTGRQRCERLGALDLEPEHRESPRFTHQVPCTQIATGVATPCHARPPLTTR